MKRIRCLSIILPSLFGEGAGVMPFGVRLLARLLVTLCLRPCAVQAQMWDRLATSDYRIDSSQVHTLCIGLDNISFFRDNEYSSQLTKGYSLPGLWVRPYVAYTPLRQIDLQLGLHALIYDGANKYPCYAYHDIARWKGQQYQKGAHLLPWFRAQAEFRNLTVVLGDIYGAQNHRLIRPLFNQEHNLSEDPEMGFQLLWDRRRLHADTWLNWQSYIFEEDSHQEAFTVGASWQVRPGRLDAPVEWYLPLNLIIQHRGGEQDTTALGVQTLCNASVGAGLRWHFTRPALRRFHAEASLLGTWQQSGHLWPFDTGAAFHASTGVNLWDSLTLEGGFFRAPRHFVSLYGNPFFSTISIRDGESHRGLSTAYARADYHYTFARHYILGAEVEAFQCWTGRSATQPSHKEFNFSFGLYLRICPTLWSWRTP